MSTPVIISLIGLLVSNTVLLMRVAFQAGKVVQQVNSHEERLNHVEQHLGLTPAKV